MANLGAGAFAQVEWAVLRQDYGEDMNVAVKRLRHDLISSDQDLSDFVKEGALLKRLNHPCVLLRNCLQALWSGLVRWCRPHVSCSRLRGCCAASGHPSGACCGVVHAAGWCIDAMPRAAARRIAEPVGSRCCRLTFSLCWRPGTS